MTPNLDLPPGITVAEDEDHHYTVEVWRALPPGDRGGGYLERLGYIDTFTDHVHLDGSPKSTDSHGPVADVDWILRHAPAPHGEDGRAIGHVL